MAALRIGDEPLTPAAVAVAAREETVDVELTAAARERIAAGRRAATEAAGQGRVYGFTTGVGANRHVDLAGDLREQSLRLLRSHAGGAGEPLPADAVRATLLVRLAQIAAGGGGHRIELACAKARCPSCATWAASAPATSRCSASSAWRWPRTGAWTSRPATRCR
jgi:histidine ammonia-lyase